MKISILDNLFNYLIIFTGKHVCITGGSSGIGLWFGINAAKQGADITIIARNIKILGNHTLILHTSYQKVNIMFRYDYRESCKCH